MSQTTFGVLYWTENAISIGVDALYTWTTKTTWRLSVVPFSLRSCQDHRALCMSDATFCKQRAFVDLGVLGMVLALLCVHICNTHPVTPSSPVMWSLHSPVRPCLVPDCLNPLLPFITLSTHSPFSLLQHLSLEFLSSHACYVFLFRLTRTQFQWLAIL